jgi:hypothetical protein
MDGLGLARVGRVARFTVMNYHTDINARDQRAPAGVIVSRGLFSCAAGLPTTRQPAAYVLLRLMSSSERNTATVSRRPTREVVSGTEPPSPDYIAVSVTRAKTGQGGVGSRIRSLSFFPPATFRAPSRYSWVRSYRGGVRFTGLERLASCDSLPQVRGFDSLDRSFQCELATVSCTTLGIVCQTICRR